MSLSSYAILKQDIAYGLDEVLVRSWVRTRVRLFRYGLGTVVNW